MVRLVQASRQRRARRRLGPGRGLTLIELLVSAGVGAVVLMGVLTALTASQGQYAQQSGISGLQASLRIGATQVEQVLARAGYGIDPNFALATRNGLGVVPALARDYRLVLDNSGPFGSDSLVVFYRDPFFRRTIVRDTIVTGSRIVLSSPPPPGEELIRGQRLLLLCEGATEGAYVTVASTQPDSGRLRVDLMTEASAPMPFNQNARVSDGSCFNSGAGVATRVEMRHFFIARMREPAGPERPALLVRRGVDVDGDNNPGEMPDNWPLGVSTNMGDADLVALDMEQLQVAYVLHRPLPAIAVEYNITAGPDSNGNFVFGDNPAGVEALHDTDEDDLNPTPNLQLLFPPQWSGNMGRWSGVGGPMRPPLLSEFGDCIWRERSTDARSCAYGSMRRFTAHVGNVRTVRYALAARSARTVPELVESTVLRPDGVTSTTPIELENLTEALSAGTRGRYHRGVLRGSVSLRNVFHRKHFVPPVDAASGLNVDGG